MKPSVLPLKKKLKTQDWAIKKTKKTQGQISIRFRKISGKNRTLPEKKQTFLVIASDFQIFYPDFTDFHHFSPKMSYFLQKTTTKMYFRANLKKTQKSPRKTLEKTQGPQKKTKNPRLLRKTQHLGRKPKQWQRWFGDEYH